MQAEKANTPKVRESALINLNSGSVKGAPMSARLCGTVARCTTHSRSLSLFPFAVLARKLWLGEEDLYEAY